MRKGQKVDVNLAQNPDSLNYIKKKLNNHVLSRREINEIIKSFDVDDYVLFRRELVNFNYFGKDSYRGVYWVKKHELSKEELDKIGKTQSKIKEMD